MSTAVSCGTMVNAFNAANINALPSKTRRLVERRTRSLGPSYRLFYQNPVHFSRGEGVFLYDSEGNEYLDAYNNVVPAGHCHPHIVAAVHKQMQTLCTHTRYLQEGILDYAEHLLETFGGRLSSEGHTLFTCTGSEANDLAMRIAQHRTGKHGIIVTAEAYHGTSHLTAGFSPSLGEKSALGAWVRQVPAPDSYRIPAENMGEWFADQVARQIKDLERHGDGLAALIVDTAFSSDGIYTCPINLLKPAIEVVHKAGGLFIADEVQAGFGRLGDAMWGYQRHGVDPDIVTMGKPMGNGFPVGGLAVLPEVIEDFGKDVRYFNTFGGNTVAMAAAQATLDVIQDEELLMNSRKTGLFMKNGIAELAKKYEVIGDIRGAGLYLGVEFVKDRRNKQPATAAATAVVNGLRERRVLISATGVEGNILKI
ncbi:aspartate aminotransferase family protein, partial [Aquamicrobium defluvii]